MPESGAVPSDHERASAIEVFLVALRLGVTAFGGPVAHIGYFHDAFVKHRRWLDDRAFADLLALCQFLPGPASSQLIFAVGMRRAGLPGALSASLGFTLPAAVLMTAAAFGLAALAPAADAGWLRGLKIAAVAVVANAVWTMARRLCPDAVRASLAIGAAILALAWPGASAQVVAILSGGAAGWLLFRNTVESEDSSAATPAPRRWWAVTALIAFAVLLIGLPVLRQAFDSSTLAASETFYRAGALVFGGGHVVLPLLESGVVDPGWVDHETFLAGYGAVQAVPGPLFSFAAYLGAVMGAGPGGVPGAVLCLIALFLPGWLLVGGAAPFWERWRQARGMQAALRGTNAAVVGVLLAALYDPVWQSGIHDARHLALGLAAFAALAWWKLPAWLLVFACTAAGAALL